MHHPQAARVAQKNQRDRRGRGRGAPQHAGDVADSELTFNDAAVEKSSGTEAHGRALSGVL